jgi:tetratricopeptide (TPR) repeat protein
MSPMNVLKTSLLFLAFFVAVSASGAAAEDADNANYEGNAGIAEEFLRRSILSAAEQSLVLGSIQSAPSDTEWVVQKEGAFYAVVLHPVPKAIGSGMQARLEDMARNAARLRSYALLYLRAVAPEVKARYADGQTIADALTEWDKRREEGERLKADLTTTLFSKEWGFAVSKIYERRLETLSRAIDEIDASSLDEAYCKIRASQARALFEQRRYVQALPVYKEIHNLRKSGVRDCFDLSECFLRVGDKKNAVLANLETVMNFGSLLDSFSLERAADIFFDSAEEGLAEKYYRQASEKLHTEQ